MIVVSTLSNDNDVSDTQEEFLAAIAQTCSQPSWRHAEDLVVVIVAETRSTIAMLAYDIRFSGGSTLQGWEPCGGVESP